MKKIEMTGVPETMIQTLYARAMESEREGHLIYDKKAMEIVKEMDYDFTKAKEDAMMRNGVVARTIVLDELVQNYVTAHPNAVVINIACGLDTRFYRVDNGKLRWFNLDLPVTIEVRKKFLEETGRVSVLPYSAMNEAWAEEVHKTLSEEEKADKKDKENGKANEKETRPTLVIMEGLTMYLSLEEVRKIFEIIRNHFTDATVLVETMSPFVVKHIKEKSIEASKAKFTWGVKNGRILAKELPGFEPVKDVSLVEGMKKLYPIYGIIGKIPAVRNISNQIIELKEV
jgi:methyltransferase (TIGR00027 family)